MTYQKEKIKTFTEVYSDHYPIVFASIYSRITNREVTMDLSQEVFTRFLEKFETVENHRKWLHGALKLVLFEHYRKKAKANNETDIDDNFDDVSMTFVNGFKDVRLIIDDALNEESNFKKEKDRILFDLIAIQNHTYKEAGKQLGLRVPQAKYQYGEIVKRIRFYLKKRGINSLEELL